MPQRRAHLELCLSRWLWSKLTPSAPASTPLCFPATLFELDFLHRLRVTAHQSSK
jgi:hypothetical protein